MEAISNKKRAGKNIFKKSHSTAGNDDGKTLKKAGNKFKQLSIRLKKRTNEIEEKVESAKHNVDDASKGKGRFKKLGKIVTTSVKKSKKVKASVEEKKEQANATLERKAAKVPGGHLAYNLAKGVLNEDMAYTVLKSSTGVDKQEVKLVQAVVTGDKKKVKEMALHSEEGNLAYCSVAVKDIKKINEERSMSSVANLGKDLGKQALRNEVGSKLDALGKVGNAVGLDVPVNGGASADARSSHKVKKGKH